MMWPMLKQLPQQLAQDRLNRLMTWAVYAKHLEIPESTLYAALAGKRMSALTRAKIEAKLPVKAARRSA